MADVFISYSSKDSKQAEILLNELEKNQIKCWIACRDVQTGSYHAKEIPPAIKACKVFVLLMSKNSLSSDDVLREVDFATSNKKEVLPFALDDFPMPVEFEYLLRTKQRYNAFPNYNAVLIQMINRIRVVLGLPPIIPAPPKDLSESKPKEEAPKVQIKEIYRDKEICAICPRCNSEYVHRKNTDLFTFSLDLNNKKLQITVNRYSFFIHISIILFLLFFSWYATKSIMGEAEKTFVFWIILVLQILFVLSMLFLLWLAKKIYKRAARKGLKLGFFECQVCNKKFFDIVSKNYRHPDILWNRGSYTRQKRKWENDSPLSKIIRSIKDFVFPFPDDDFDDYDYYYDDDDDDF